jgi:predicted small lipoprotein YifL
MHRLALIAATLCLVCASADILSACGQKGPLKAPAAPAEQKVKAIPDPASQTTPPAQQDKK